MSARKIIIDTDPGVDDAMAILMALRSPELEVVGLTSVYGNTTIDKATRNARALVAAAGQPDVPVARGAGAPLARAYEGPFPAIHGAEGMGDAPIEEPRVAEDPRGAVELMAQLAAESPGEITLLTIGPLTNLALAVFAHPTLSGSLREIVTMGCAAFCRGNVTPEAEANIWLDPDAAEAVFALDCRLSLVGLDVTDTVLFSAERIREVAARTDPGSRLLARVMPVYQRFNEEHFHSTGRPGYDGLCPHDAVAVAYLLHPELFETTDSPLRVVLTDDARGRTVVDASATDRRPATICTGGDTDAITALIAERLARHTASDTLFRTS